MTSHQTFFPMHDTGINLCWGWLGLGRRLS